MSRRRIFTCYDPCPILNFMQEHESQVSNTHNKDERDKLNDCSEHNEDKRNELGDCNKHNENKRDEHIIHEKPVCCYSASPVYYSEATLRLERERL